MHDHPLPAEPVTELFQLTFKDCLEYPLYDTTLIKSNTFFSQSFLRVNLYFLIQVLQLDTCVNAVIPATIGQQWILAFAGMI